MAQSAISVPAGVRIELQPRAMNDTTFRIGSVQEYRPLAYNNNNNNAPKLRAGMYLMAAIQGRTRVSFFKLAEPIVRRELDRLQNSGSDYLVLVSETSSSFLQLPIPAPPTLLSSPKHTPNSGDDDDDDDDDDEEAQLHNSRHSDIGDEDEDNDEGEEDSGSLTSSLFATAAAGGSADQTILQSVERLRAQRRAVEQIKRDSAQKSIKITNLEQELANKASDWAHMERENEELRRVSWMAGVREDALEQEKQRAFQLEVEVNALRAQNKQYEDSTASLLAQEKKLLAESRMQWTKLVEEAQLENKGLVLRVQEAQKSAQQAHLEREASEQREESTRRAYERLSAEQREREAKLEHTLDRTRQERDRQAKRVEELDLALQTARNQCGVHREALDSAREQLLATGKRVDDLEQECEALRQDVAGKAQQLAAQARAADTDVDQLQHELELQHAQHRETKTEITTLRQKVEEEVRLHRQTKEELVRSEGGRRELAEAMDRAQRHAKTCAERLGEMTRAKEALHDRLVRALEKGNALADEVEQERMAGKALAESRLDLLAQFVEEERRLDGALSQPPPQPQAPHQQQQQQQAGMRRTSSGRGRLEFASPSSVRSRSSGVTYTPQSTYSYASAPPASASSTHSSNHQYYASTSAAAAAPVPVKRPTNANSKH